jgi:hypothetical protein
MPFLVPIGAAVATGLGATGTAATLIGGATTIGLGFGLAKAGTSLLGGLFGGGEAPQVPAAPTAPSFEEAQGTSLEEQREKLRGKSKTTLTSNNLLSTAGETEKKTLLGG